MESRVDFAKVAQIDDPYVFTDAADGSVPWVRGRGQHIVGAGRLWPKSPAGLLDDTRMLSAPSLSWPRLRLIASETDLRRLHVAWSAGGREAVRGASCGVISRWSSTASDMDQLLGGKIRIVAQIPRRGSTSMTSGRALPTSDGGPDTEIMEFALRDDRVVISADTDFGELLARSQASLPSVILLRRNHDPGSQASAILAALPDIGESLAVGSIVVITSDRLRVRDLPIN